MQIIFDSRFDGVADAHRMRDMLTAYITSREGVVTNVVNVLAPATPIAEQADRILRPVDQSVPVQQTSFQPGDLSGSAPSPAVAAPAPTAPEVSTAGVPPPPNVASVPAPPVAAPEAPAALSTSAPTGDVDSAGLPWDKRIHSSSKAKNADGSWRKLRGLNDAALVSRVEAELRSQGVQALAAGGYVAPPPPMPAGGVAPTPPHAATVPPPPGTVVAPPVPAAPDVATPEGLMEWVTPRMMDGRLTFDTVAAALQANGVESLAALKTNPAAVPGVYAALGGT